MSRSRRLVLLATLSVFMVALVAVLILGLAPRGRSHSGTASDSPGSPTESPPSSLSPLTSPPPTALALSRAQRVVAILDQMQRKALNPNGRPAAAGAPRGGTFINWGATWDGDPSSAGDNTNFNTDGRTDAQLGREPRHDEFTDLLLLRNVAGYASSHPLDPRFDKTMNQLEPVVRGEFSRYTFYKCSLYDELRDLERFRPGRGWGQLASTYIHGVEAKTFDKDRGTIIDKRYQAYRVDYAMECGAAMVEEGGLTQDANLIAAGRSTIAHLLAQAADPSTHLFPLQMHVADPSDTVAQAQLKVGDEAQILEALLRAYDVTHDRSYLGAVVSAVTTLYSPQLRLYDSQRAGFFFSVDSSGANLQATYKESRQAWMLPLLEHLDREQPGKWTAQSAAMLTVIMDRLWQPLSTGYVYRLTPDFGYVHTNSGANRSAVTETWVTAEAMDIVAQCLEAN